MDTFAQETEEWKEAQMRYGQYRGTLDRGLERGVGFQNLRSKLNESGGDKARIER